MIDMVTFRLKGRGVLNRLFAPLFKLLLRAYFSYRHRRTKQLLVK